MNIAWQNKTSFHYWRLKKSPKKGVFYLFIQTSFTKKWSFHNLSMREMKWYVDIFATKVGKHFFSILLRQNNCQQAIPNATRGWSIVKQNLVVEVSSAFVSCPKRLPHQCFVTNSSFANEKKPLVGTPKNNSGLFLGNKTWHILSIFSLKYLLSKRIARVIFESSHWIESELMKNYIHSQIETWKF